MRVLVLGAAVSGRAALRLLEAEGHDLIVHDANPAAVEGLAGVRTAVGGEWDPALLESIDLVVPSPGISTPHRSVMPWPQGSM